MKRFLTTVLMIAVIGAALAFLAAPLFAFFSLRSSAQARDVQTLSELIDFNAVRTSLRPQLSGDMRPQSPAPSILQDPIGALRRQFEQVRPAPDVENFLTPDALAGLTDGEGRLAAQRSQTGVTLPAPAEGAFRAPWPRIRYWDFNRVRLAVADLGGAETVFTFARKTVFGWRLVHIGLPEGADPEPPRVSETP
ncbi:MAG TPA: DUF2939 domain-containing protein [Caulobacteraceae bacterium]